MVGERSRYGLFVSAVGAIVLAVSVFLTWYATSPTMHAGLGDVARVRPHVITANEALPGLSVILLVLAALAMLDVLVPLARAAVPVPGGAGGSVVLLGILAAACVLYRMVDPPAPAAEALALSLREGAWLALLGSITMTLGGMWPRCVYCEAGSDARSPGGLSGIAGWTIGG